MRRICKYCGAIFDGDPAALGCPDCVEARRHDTVRPRVCRTCGAVFDGGPRAWYCPDCRAERKRRHDREQKARKRAGEVRALGSTDLCAICGKPYVVKGGLQRYCPDCAPETVRQIALAQTKAWNAVNAPAAKRRANRKAQAAPIPCAICGKPFIPTGGALTCSPACSRQLAEQGRRRWEQAHLAERVANNSARVKQKLDAMSDEEREAYRLHKNAMARAAYARRMARKKAARAEPENNPKPR